MDDITDDHPCGYWLPSCTVTIEKDVMVRRYINSHPEVVEGLT